MSKKKYRDYLCVCGHGKHTHFLQNGQREWCINCGCRKYQKKDVKDENGVRK